MRRLHAQNQVWGLFVSQDLCGLAIFKQPESIMGLKKMFSFITFTAWPLLTFYLRKKPIVVFFFPSKKIVVYLNKNSIIY